MRAGIWLVHTACSHPPHWPPLMCPVTQATSLWEVTCQHKKSFLANPLHSHWARIGKPPVLFLENHFGMSLEIRMTLSAQDCWLINSEVSFQLTSFSLPTSSHYAFVWWETTCLRFGMPTIWCARMCMLSTEVVSKRLQKDTPFVATDTPWGDGQSDLQVPFPWFRSNEYYCVCPPHAVFNLWG